MCCSISSLLPSEIIYDLLVRLPVKSLIRFKCVCKSWYALIESPDFIKSHHKHSLETNSNLSLIFSHDNISLPESWIYCTNGLHDQFSQTNLATKLYLSPPFVRDFYIGFEILGSSNGLICLGNCFGLALINPSTRFCKLVSHFYGYAAPFKPYGFGYDCRGDDYKIVAISSWAIVVYSLRANSWGKLRHLNQESVKKGNHESVRKDKANGVIVNGRLHWILYRRKSVLSFDLYDEKCTEVSLPNNCDDNVDNLWGIELGVLDGCLCATYSSRSSSNEGCSHVWVMKEYGVKESWTTLFSFPFLEAIPLVNTKERHEVLFRKGCNKGLFLWNSKEKTTREIEGPMVHYSEVVVCVDSLAPLMHDFFILRAQEIKKEERD